MTEPTRRAVLAAGGGALASLAGCVSSPDTCSPATFPPEDSTETREDPPEPCQFGAELQSRGMDVDSTMDSAAGGASVMYMRDPGKHREQIQTVALAFVPYRRMVGGDGNMLSYTALETNDNRHGDGYITREWADRRASGQLTRTEYVQKVVDTYETR